MDLMLVKCKEIADTSINLVLTFFSLASLSVFVLLIVSTCLFIFFSISFPCIRIYIPREETFPLTRKEKLYKIAIN